MVNTWFLCCTESPSNPKQSWSMGLSWSHTTGAAAVVGARTRVCGSTGSASFSSTCPIFCSSDVVKGHWSSRPFSCLMQIWCCFVLSSMGPFQFCPMAWWGHCGWVPAAHPFSKGRGQNLAEELVGWVKGRGVTQQLLLRPTPIHPGEG